MNLLDSLKEQRTTYNWNKKPTDYHGVEMKDVRDSKDEYLLVHKDAPFDVSSDAVHFNGTHYAIPTTAGTVNAVNGYTPHVRLDTQIRLANKYSTSRSEIEKYISTSVVPHEYSKPDHYAILDVPMDMEKDVQGIAKRSNRGTYFLKIPKELHDKFQSEAFYENGKIKRTPNRNRGANLILFSNGIDANKTNNARMRIEVSQTYTPEQISKMKG